MTNGRRKFEINVIKSDGSKKLSIEEITADEREGKDLLGSAIGVDMNHCIYLGSRHGKDFLSRVRWYFKNNQDKDLLRFNEEKRRSTLIEYREGKQTSREINLNYICIEFYGERKR